MSQIGQEALAHPGLRTLVAARDHVIADRLGREVFGWAVDNKVPGVEVSNGWRRISWPNGSVTQFTGVYTVGEAMRRYGTGEWQRMYLDPALDPEIREYLCSRLRSSDPKVPVLGAVDLDLAVI
jgi:hypothetical protein